MVGTTQVLILCGWPLLSMTEKFGVHTSNGLSMIAKLVKEKRVPSYYSTKSISKKVKRVE